MKMKLIDIKNKIVGKKITNVITSGRTGEDYKGEVNIKFEDGSSISGFLYLYDKYPKQVICEKD